MQNVIRLLVIGLLTSSCATVHKVKSSNVSDQLHIDTSSQVHQYIRETVVEEKSDTSVTTDVDSVETSGSMSTGDTTEYTQSVETGDMSLITIMKPRIKNGKVTGYDVNSKSVTKPKIVDVPFDRKTTTKETGTDKQQTGISDTKKEVVTTNKKETAGLSIWVRILVIGSGIIFLCWLIFRLWK